MLTYLLKTEDLTPEEVKGHVIDVVANGVDQVSVEKRCIIIIYYLMNGVVNQYYMSSSLHDTLLTRPSSFAVIVIVIFITVCASYDTKAAFNNCLIIHSKLFLD